MPKKAPKPKLTQKNTPQSTSKSKLKHGQVIRDAKGRLHTIAEHEPEQPYRDNPLAPEGSEVITTFAEYEEIADAFFAGHFSLLILVGRPGLSKSWEFEQRITKKKKGLLVRGNASAFRAYQLIYTHRNQDLIFDDAELLWDSKDGRVLLRQVTEMKEEKEVSWEKHSPILDKEGIPHHFHTKSKVAILCNTLRFGHSEEYEAICDRGHLIFFDPPPAEVHRYCRSWFEKKGPNTPDVYSHIGERLDYLPNLSFRTYLKLLEAKRAGRNWRRILETSYMIKPDQRLIVDLEASGRPVEECVVEWCERTGKARATYFNQKKAILRHGTPKKRGRKPRGG
ncbi:MAG: hypothetical protein ACYC0X_23620 [Pirellulaceae bacterium]